MIINNDTQKYVNQYYDVIDVPETPEKEPLRTCNVSCVAMIPGEDVNDVLDYFFNKYGYEIGVKSPHYQWQKLLIDYIVNKGFKCDEILKKPAWPDSRNITDDELKIMTLAIRNGKIIFYHKAGHYQLMTGFSIQDKKINYIFNDPAGDRKLIRRLRTRESGHGVVYPLEMVKREKIYGQCWSVEI